MLLFCFISIFAIVILWSFVNHCLQNYEIISKNQSQKCPYMQILLILKQLLHILKIATLFFAYFETRIAYFETLLALI